MRKWTMGNVVAIFMIGGVCAAGIWLFFNFWQNEVERLNRKGPLGNKEKPLGAPEQVLKRNEDPAKDIAVIMPPRAINNQPEQPPVMDGQPPLLPDPGHLARSRFKAIKTKASGITELFNQAEKEVASWEAHHKSLFHADAGRRIASNRDHIQQIVGLLDETRPPVNQIKTWREQLKAIVDPVEKAEKDEKSVFLPGDGFFQDLDKINRGVTEFLRGYERDRQTLEAILADSQGNKLSEKGLQHAIQDLTGELSRKRAAAIAEAKQTAFDEITKKLAAAEAEAVKVLGEIEAKRLMEKTAAEKITRELQAALELKAEEQKQLELRYKAVEPEIKSLLKGFISNGYVQVTQDGSFRKETKTGPMSFSAIQGTGCLKKDEINLRRLWKAPQPAGGTFGYNDRPLGSFPGYRDNEEAWNRAYKTVIRAQDLLNEFGPLLVEKGLLAP